MILFYITNFIGYVLIFLGLCTCGISIIGLFRFKTVLERQHVLGLIDTLGAFFILIGLAFLSGYKLVSAKPVLLGFLMAIISAPSCYLMMKIINITSKLKKENR